MTGYHRYCDRERSELGGVFYPDTATPAEHAAFQRDSARALLHQARVQMRWCYQELGRYPGRFSRLAGNVTARMHHEQARLALGAARDALRAADRWAAPPAA